MKIARIGQGKHQKAWKQENTSLEFNRDYDVSVQSFKDGGIAYVREVERERSSAS